MVKLLQLVVQGFDSSWENSSLRNNKLPSNDKSVQNEMLYWKKSHWRRRREDLEWSNILNKHWRRPPHNWSVSVETGRIGDQKAKVSNVWLASFPSKILWLSLIFKEKSDGGKRERIGWQTMSSRDSNAAISLHAFLNILRCWKQASFVRSFVVRGEIYGNWNRGSIWPAWHLLEVINLAEVCVRERERRCKSVCEREVGIGRDHKTNLPK